MYCKKERGNGSICFPLTCIYSFRHESATSETPSFPYKKTHPKMTEWKRKRGLSLQHEINMRSQLVTEGWIEGWGEGGLWVLVEQLQVGDWHFALLVSSLTHQPV